MHIQINSMVLFSTARITIWISSERFHFKIGNLANNVALQTLETLKMLQSNLEDNKKNLINIDKSWKPWKIMETLKKH